MHAVGARRGGGAGHTELLRMASSFPEVCGEARFLFTTRVDLAPDVEGLSSEIEVASPPRGLPVLGRPLWEFLALPRVLSRWGPDVIFGVFNLLPVRMPRGVPKVVMIHNLLPFSGARRLYRWPHRLKLEALRILGRRSIGRADKVLVLSELSVDLIGRRALGNRAVRLPAALPTVPAGVAWARSEEDRPRFVVPANLLPHKGIETVVRAAALVPNCEVAVFGHPSDSRYERALRSEIRHLGVEDRVTLLPAVSHEQILSEMAAAAATVTPSLFENLSLVLLEALAVGCPLVASDIPGAREVVGNAALFFEAGDETSLASAFREIVARPDLAERLSSDGRGRFGQMSGGNQYDVILEQLKAAAARGRS